MTKLPWIIHKQNELIIYLVIVCYNFLSYFFYDQVELKSVSTFATGMLMLIIHNLQLANMQDVIKMAFVLNVNYFPQPVLFPEMAWSHKRKRHWLKMVYAEVWVFPANIIQRYLLKVWRCLVLLRYNIRRDTIFMMYSTIFVRTASKAPDKLQCDCSETGWDENKPNHKNRKPCEFSFGNTVCLGRTRNMPALHLYLSGPINVFMKHVFMAS